jgi:hypothetical protein
MSLDIESPAGESPRYGYDALRVLVQLAVDCDRSGQSIAARPWPFLRGEVGDGLAVAYDLALGRVWLDTDLLGGCRPGHPRSD